MTAEPMVDPQGLTATLMTDLVIANVSGLVQEARNDCPSVTHSNWCYREAFRTLARYTEVTDVENVRKVLTDLAMMFDPETVRNVLADDKDEAGGTEAKAA